MKHSRICDIRYGGHCNCKTKYEWVKEPLATTKNPDAQWDEAQEFEEDDEHDR